MCCSKRFLPDLFFQYFLYSIHAPTAKITMHAIVPKIVPATAPPQVAASADMLEPALSIFGGDQRRKSQVKIHLFGLICVDAREAHTEKKEHQSREVKCTSTLHAMRR